LGEVTADEVLEEEEAEFAPSYYRPTIRPA
jgi:hypothetical protein